MAQDEALAKALAYRKSRILRSQANAGRLKAASASRSLEPSGGYSPIAQILADVSKIQPQAQPEQEKDNDEWFEKPVIKQIIDTIVTPGMMVSNSLSNIQERMYDANDAGLERARQKGQEGMGDLGNRMQTMVEGMNPATFVGDVVAGFGEGLSGGIGGNKNDVKHTSHLIKSAQEYSGIDPESPESRAVQGWGGFAGDVIMDPLNAVPLSPAIKYAQGMKQGSRDFRAAEIANKRTGVEMPSNLAPSRWENAKQQAKTNVAEYKLDKARVQAAKEATRSFKKEARKARKAGDTAKVSLILENIETLKEAVGKKDDALIAEVLNRTNDVPDMGPVNPARFTADSAGNVVDDIPVDRTPDTPETPIPDAPPVAKPDEVIPEAAATVVPKEARLSNFKEPTELEKLVDLIGQYKSVNKSRAYDAPTTQKIRDFIEAKTVRNKVPVAKNVPEEFDEVLDLKATVDELKKVNKIAIAGANGKPVYVNSADMIADLKKAPKSKEGMERWQALVDTLDESGFVVTKRVAREAPKATDEFIEEVIEGRTRITDDELKELGVKPDHFEDIRAGKAIEELVDDMPTEEISALTKDIRSGKVKVDPFKALLGEDFNKNQIADVIDSIASTDAFTQTAKELAKYGSKRAGRPDPELGVSGSAKLAMPSAVAGTADDILASLTPTNPEVAKEYLEAVYKENIATIANMERGAELRTLADDVFKATIDTQRQPAGPRRAIGGASVKEDLSGAKYETRHNTHAAMFRMKHIAQQLLAKGYDDKGKFDDAYMAVLRDVDNRLRLAGFDQHLSNMATTADKLVVRLAPSDVLGLMTKSDRIKFLHGNMGHSKGIAGKSGSTLNEFYFTTILDMAEVLVRSATKLNPDGSVDEAATFLNALHTLQAKYQPNGQRVIKNNLDIKTWERNHSEIIKEIDRANKLAGKETNFLAQFTGKVKDSKGQPFNPANVIETVKNAYPDLYKQAAEKRMTKITNDLLNVFTQKGRFDPNNPKAKSSRINDLIALNMRNASVMGGTLTDEITQASAAFSAKILDALDNGTGGDFISSLVSRPAIETTDKVAKQIVDDNARIAREAVATSEEIKHFTATERNVRAAKAAGARSDAEIGKVMLKAKMMRAGKGVRPVITQASNKEAIRRKQAAKNNKDAYQKDPDLDAENAKPLKDQDPDVLFDLAQRELNKDVIWRAFGPRRWFDRRAGMRNTYDQITGSLHATPLIMTGFHAVLKELRVKGYSKVQLHTAFQTLKAGSPNDPISSELNAVLDKLFDPAQNNFLSRNSIGPRHFNKVLESVGFDKAKVFVDESLTPDEMRNVWKHWEVDDVEDFFSKMMGAMTKTSHEVAIGASFSKHFGQANPAPGYVKITDKSQKNSLYELIDQDLYYPKDIAYEFVHVGRMIDESRSFKPSDPLYKFVTQIMDPTVSLLKMTQTTMKPGHHVMSVVGDLWRNNLALSTIGYMNPAKQMALLAESVRILKTNLGPIEELSGFEQFARTQRITKRIRVGMDENGNLHVDKKGETYANIKGGGQISHEDMYAIMQAEGISTPAYLGGGGMEDMLAETGGMAERGTNMVAKGISKVSQGMDKLANDLIPAGKNGKKFSLNKFTANRDSFTRQALFLGAMRSRKFDSLEEAVRYSSNFVRKWAPTAVDLSAFEAKYARRMFFYYTWLRGMIPRIIESALLTPGIAVIPNRAMYNLGVANGIDLNSVGDPFPDDRLFPDWYTKNVLGPSYKVGDDLWGFNPTGPLGDVMNSLGSGVTPKDFLGMEAVSKVGQTFANMSTPWIKAPTETLLLNKTVTGVPIEDDMEYAQDMIGPLRTASRALGKDFYPMITDQGVGIPNRTEKKYEYGMTPEETLQNALPELLNYMTGGQFTNYTSDSAENSAYYQSKETLDKYWKDRERLGQW